jgi:hypothetical protein
MEVIENIEENVSEQISAFDLSDLINTLDIPIETGRLPVRGSERNDPRGPGDDRLVSRGELL